MPIPYWAALKILNANRKKKDPEACWCAPRKGTDEYLEVLRIMRSTTAAEAAEDVAEEAEEKMEKEKNALINLYKTLPEDKRRFMASQVSYLSKEPEMKATRAKALEGLRKVESESKARNEARKQTSTITIPPGYHDRVLVPASKYSEIARRFGTPGKMDENVDRMKGLSPDGLYMYMDPEGKIRFSTRVPKSGGRRK
jgi:hypothetical protein